MQIEGKEDTGHRVKAPSVALHANMTVEEFGQCDLAYALPFSPTWDPMLTAANQLRKDNYEFFKECFKQSVLLAMEAGIASLGHVSLDGSKFKANTSKHKAMSYGRLKVKEKELTEEIGSLIAKASKCVEEEEYQDKTGYEIPEELKIKEKRLTKIKEAKEALEKREQELNPGKKIDGQFFTFTQLPIYESVILVENVNYLSSDY